MNVNSIHSKNYRAILGFTQGGTKGKYAHKNYEFHMFFFISLHFVIILYYNRKETEMLKNNIIRGIETIVWLEPLPLAGFLASMKDA